MCKRCTRMYIRGHRHAHAANPTCMDGPCAFSVTRREGEGEDGDDVILEIDDVITGDVFLAMFGIGISAGDISSALSRNASADRIEVRLNSPGGEVTEGTAIFNALRLDGRPVTVRVTGLAASIAATIAMAGDEIVIEPGGMMMIHNPHLSLRQAEAGELRKGAALLDKTKAAMLSVFDERTGDASSREQLSEAMDAETWLTGSEAVDLGLADSVGSLRSPGEGEAGDGASASLRDDAWHARRGAMLSHFVHPPQIAAHGGALGWSGPSHATIQAAVRKAALDGTTITQALAIARKPTTSPAAKPAAQRGTMEREKMLDMLGLPADASETDIHARMLEVKSAEARAEKAQADAQEAQAKHEAELAKLEADRQAKALDDHATAAEAFISKSLESGQILPAERGGWESLVATPEGLASAEAIIAKRPAITGPANRGDTQVGAAAANVTRTSALPVRYAYSKHERPLNLTRLTKVTRKQIDEHREKLLAKEHLADSISTKED
jgi:ATP-dependent protease ClpP protease subunit